MAEKLATAMTLRLSGLAMKDIQDFQELQPVCSFDTPACSMAVPSVDDHLQIRQITLTEWLVKFTNPALIEQFNKGSPRARQRRTPPSGTPYADAKRPAGLGADSDLEEAAEPHPEDRVLEHADAEKRGPLSSATSNRPQPYERVLEARGVFATARP